MPIVQANPFDGLWVDTSNPAGPDAHQLQGWWKVVEGLDGGKFLYDLHGLRHGTLSSATWKPSPVRPGGFGAIGCTGGGNVSIPMPLVASGDDFTLSFWHYPIAATGGFMTLFSDSAGSRCFTIFIDGTGNNSGFAGTMLLDTGNFSMTMGSWWHFVASRVSGIENIYVDGALIVSGANTGASLGLPLFFGAADVGGGTAYNGYYDDFRFIHKRGLAAADVAALFGAGRQPEDPRLNYVGDWPMVAGGTTYNESGSGGISFGGSATVQASYSASGSGGLSLAGAATPQATYNQAASGGIVLAGAATVQETCNVAGSGSLTLSGAASVQCNYALAGGGGLNLGGSAAVMATYNTLGAGGIVFSGSAAISGVVTYSETGSGGVVLGGSATVSATYNLAGGGGIVLGGSASIDDNITLITDVGIQWTLAPSLMHYTLAENHMHWTLPEDDS